MRLNLRLIGSSDSSAVVPSGPLSVFAIEQKSISQTLECRNLNVADSRIGRKSKFDSVSKRKTKLCAESVSVRCFHTSSFATPTVSSSLSSSAGHSMPPYSSHDSPETSSSGDPNLRCAIALRHSLAALAQSGSSLISRSRSARLSGSGPSVRSLPSCSRQFFTRPAIELYPEYPL